jgi:trimeric autotransporter adhesin
MSNGCNQNPNGACSEAEGLNTTANGTASHAEGSQTIANGNTSHAEGNTTTAGGTASHTEGHLTQTPANTAHAEGTSTTASGVASHAEGYLTMASGTHAHAEGNHTTASALDTHSEGQFTTANNTAAHAEGISSTASGEASHAEGRDTQAFGGNSHTEGFQTITGDVGDPTQGMNAHAEGEGNTATGRASHAEGGAVDQNNNPAPTLASGDSAHAEGVGTTASGFASHAEGGTDNFPIFPGPVANGSFSHAEGFRTTASGFSSHAEGFVTRASGFFGSHAEGRGTTASGIAGSHAEGFQSTASGFASHSEGQNTTASGDASHAEGEGNIAGHMNSHIMGRFGDTEEDHSWFIGNGTTFIARGLGAKWLASSGDMFVDGAFVPGGADYAEMFETLDGNAIDVGYFVTTEGDKIRKATGDDMYVLGVTSATPGIIGDSGEMRWKGKFVTDEWGRIQHHEVMIQAEKDKEGNVLIPEKKEMQPMLNPEWDPQREYIPRKKRPEWVPVGMIGKVLVRDDGTCEVDGYCIQNDEGIATKASKGYRVMKRTGENQVLVLINSKPSTNKHDFVVKLEKLAKLKEQGYLTEEEFQSEKQKLLDS